MKCKKCGVKMEKPACIVMHIEPEKQNAHVEVVDLCGKCNWIVHDAFRIAGIKAKKVKA